MVTDSMTGVNQQLRLLLTLVGISFENYIDILALFKNILLALLIGDTFSIRISLYKSSASSI